MCIANEDATSRKLMSVGMLLIALADVARFIVQRQHIASDSADGFTGLLFGLVIGILLLGVYRRTHSR